MFPSSAALKVKLTTRLTRKQNRRTNKERGNAHHHGEELQVERRWKQGSANEADARQVWGDSQTVDEHKRETEHQEHRSAGRHGRRERHNKTGNKQTKKPKS